MTRYAVRNKTSWYKPGSPDIYKLSRTRIDNFFKCPRCFWMEERFGVKKPDTYPLTLNIAVDGLLKKEFDVHRAKQVPHPLMKAYGIEAVPFKHESIDAWRHNFTGVRYLHTPTNLLIFGAVDDVWADKDKQLFVVDYKATAKADTPTLTGNLGEQYKRQMEVYQWLLRRNDFLVSPTGYFVYVNGKKDTAAFDAKLEFDVIILPCIGNTDWIDPILFEIKKCLDEKSPPMQGEECEYCPYREAAQNVLTIESTDQPKRKNRTNKIITDKNENVTKELF